MIDNFGHSHSAMTGDATTQPYNDTAMIAVIVINYRSEARTTAFVRDELSKISLPHKVIVVDNGSTEESEAALRAGLPNGVTLLPLSENVGFARGNNAGAQYAKEHFLGEAQDDLLLFTNNDIRLASADVVETLAEELRRHPEAAVIGPMVRGLDGKPQSPHKPLSFWDCHVWTYWSTPFMSKERHERVFGYDPDPQSGPCHYVSGSFFLVRAADYFRCGMMDPHTFLYAEEPILAERLRRIGKGERFCAEATVIHEHGATTKEHYSKLRLRRMVLDANWYYYHTYRGTPRWQLWAAKATLSLKELFGK